jgi:Tfp pilus assembly protein PilE
MIKNIRIRHYAFASLIELLTAFGIAAILAFVTVPYYKQYSIRARISTLAGALQTVQAQVLQQRSSGTVYGNTTTVQIASNDANLPKYMSQLSIANYGCIRLDFNLTQLGLTSSGGQILALMLCPKGDANNPDLVTWSCGYSSDSTVAYGTYLPSNCQQQVTQDTSF